MNILLNFFVINFFLTHCTGDSDETVLYYYGLEESERGLPHCVHGQACSALVSRYWRPPALLRLCRCARRQRCDTPAPHDRLVEINNRAYLQFCNPVASLPECATNNATLSVETSYEKMNPDEIEKMHHENIHLTPPTVILTCRCKHPNYWKLKSVEGKKALYQCSSLLMCKTGDFCGNVDNDLLTLYQSCLCPKKHICVHNGGISQTQISELLYRGTGWKAYCQPISDDYSFEDY